MIGVVAVILIGQIGKKVELLLRYKQQGFEPQTSMDQGRINAPLLDIELATFASWSWR